MTVDLAPPPAASAPAPLRFAPPLGRPLLYRVVERQPGPAGETVVTLTEALRFDRAAGGRLLVTQTLREAVVAASPGVRAVLEALEGAFVGHSLAMQLEPDGTPGALVDPEGSWAEVAASFAAMERRAGEAGVASPEQQVRIGAMIRAQMPQSTAARDERLRAAIAKLLPPPEPPLAPGEDRAFETSIAAAGGQIAAHGRAAILERTADRLRYRSEVTADRAAAASAAASLRARLTDATPPVERARIEAAATALAATAFSQQIEVTIDARTGLLRSLVNRRFAIEAGAENRLIAEQRTDLLDSGI